MYIVSSKQNFYEIYLETIKSQNKLQPKTTSDRFLSVSDIRKEGCFVKRTNKSPLTKLTLSKILEIKLLIQYFPKRYSQNNSNNAVVKKRHQKALKRCGF